MGALNLSLTEPAMNLSRYVRMMEDGSCTFEVAVKGARCANCIAKIEKGIGALPGVEQSRLNLSTGKLAVKGRGLVPGKILQRLRDIGYEAQPFEAAECLNADEAEGQFLLRCLAVSGSATVFVMGLTDGVWYGTDISDATRQLFFWLAGVVAIPASLYAGQPFFRSAWRAMASGNTSMDVPISLAVLLALGLSIYQTSSHGIHTYFDAAVMLVFLLLIGRYLDFRLRDRARGAARHLLTLQSVLARRQTPAGDLETVTAKEVVPGDLLFLATGDRIPVNGTVEGHATELDLSLVTGEIAPQLVDVGTPVQAGTIVTGRAMTLRATAAVENSLVADLARLLEAGQQTRSAYVRLADRAAALYVPIVFSLSLLALVGWLIAGATPAQAVTNAIAVLIITCPCALGLAVPAVQIVATERLFKRGVFVKSGDALERLAEIDTAIFDKTGTLTEGKPVLLNAQYLEAGILESAALIARASRHPLARAIALAAGEGPAANDVREIAGAGLERDTGGNIERLGSAAWCGALERGHQLWYRRGKEAPVGFLLEDGIRADSGTLIQSLSQRGLKIEMLSGDNAANVRAVAEQVGIASWFSGVTPQQKAARLQSLRELGHHVLMVGDGINDAAAMALAHVSIAPGTATDISQRASDMVLRGNELGPIVEAFDVARKARRLVLVNFGLAAAYNLTAIPLAAMGYVTPLIAAATMAGSSLLVIANALRLAAPRLR